MTTGREKGRRDDIIGVRIERSLSFAHWSWEVVVLLRHQSINTAVQVFLLYFSFFRNVGDQNENE